MIKSSILWRIATGNPRIIVVLFGDGVTEQQAYYWLDINDVKLEKTNIVLH